MINIFSIAIATFSCLFGCGQLNNVKFAQSVVENEDSGYIYTEAYNEDGGWCLKNISSLQAGDQLLIVYDDGGTVDIYDDTLLLVIRL